MVDAQLVSRASANTKRMRGWVVGMVSFLAVLVWGGAGAIAMLLTPTTELDEIPTLSMETRALNAATGFFAALTDGDSGAALAYVAPALAADPRVRSAVEFLAALPGEKVGKDCDAKRGGGILVSCLIKLGDPLYRATDQEVKPGFLRFDNDLLISSLPELGYRSAVDRTFVLYASAAEPEEFAAHCDPERSSPGAAVEGNGYLLTGSCGQLWARIAEDAAKWLAAGRPPTS